MKGLWRFSKPTLSSFGRWEKYDTERGGGLSEATRGSPLSQPQPVALSSDHSDLCVCESH